MITNLNYQNDFNTNPTWHKNFDNALYGSVHTFTKFRVSKTTLSLIKSGRKNSMLPCIVEKEIVPISHKCDLRVFPIRLLQ